MRKNMLVVICLAIIAAIFICARHSFAGNTVSWQARCYVPQFVKTSSDATAAKSTVTADEKTQAKTDTQMVEQKERIASKENEVEIIHTVCAR